MTIFFFKSRNPNACDLDSVIVPVHLFWISVSLGTLARLISLCQPGSGPRTFTLQLSLLKTLLPQAFQWLALWYGLGLCPDFTFSVRSSHLNQWLWSLSLLHSPLAALLYLKGPTTSHFKQVRLDPAAVATRDPRTSGSKNDMLQVHTGRLWLHCFQSPPWDPG